MTVFNKLALVVVAAAGVQLVSAQSSVPDSISSQCQSALGAIVQNPDASCLNAQALVGLVVKSSSSSDTSVVSSVDTWLKGLCGKPLCSNDVLAAVVQNVTSGCSSDLSALGLSNIDAGQLTTLVQQAYPTARQSLCLADTSNGNTLCVTESLNDIEQYTGSLTIANLESLANAAFQGSFPNIPANISCTDCSKAAFGLVAQQYGDLIPDNFKTEISNTCGASFLDGAQPATVTQLATNAGSSTTVTPNGAAPSISAAPLVGIVASSLLAISSAFVLLA
ncbi:hypothetical protein C8Q74DRAFT_1260930 [Fomes fomentarius]|nr:hypothetical protein C8Q74DRAFT_1260930 [Fomes fomentarius]